MNVGQPVGPFVLPNEQISSSPTSPPPTAGHHKNEGAGASNHNRYDVTAWHHGDPVEDIGAVINSIIADVKARQTVADDHDLGKPGAVIYIPPGDYRLRTQVKIDISFLRLEGSGHGFTSSSIRFNVAEGDVPGLHELWPGGSRILVDIPAGSQSDEAAGAAFHVGRSGSPRISSVEFSNFCIDGMHFVGVGVGVGVGSEVEPENTYVNGKTGIYVADANDAFRINEMGFVYLEHALTIYHADALSIHDNFIAECGNCIELRGWGQASKITDNLLGAGFHGYTIHAENHGGLLVTANNVFPRGASSVHFDGVTRSSLTNNRLHAFYPGMVVLTGNSSENLIGGNHLLRDQGALDPLQGVDNGCDDLFGLINITGDNNSVIGNHVSEILDTPHVRPAAATPIIIRLTSGGGNYVANNHVVALDVRAPSGDSAFAAQVEALLTTEAPTPLTVITVFADPDSTGNTILDSGQTQEVIADRTVNAVRVTPAVGS